MNIVILGYGAIASYVASTLASDQRVQLTHVICRPGREAAARQAMGVRCALVNTVQELTEPVDLVLECAGHEGLAEHGPAILTRGFNLLAVSTGALADDGLADKLEQAASQGGGQLEIASGAIGAIDAIAAAAVGGLESVICRGRKPAAGWRGSPAEQLIDLDNLTEPVCFFRGTARQAAMSYPKNANVTATVALAGVGLDNTQVELIADPTVTENIHEIEADGVFGRLFFSIAGKALPTNPKSSALTAMSLVAHVRKRLSYVAV